MSFASNKIDFETLEEPTRFELKDLVGEGTYGEVYAAVDLSAEDGKLSENRI
jgi:serine/threonine protein kinase